MDQPPTTHGYRRLAVVATALSLVLIGVGGAVRATDSGLACPTWPGCFTAGDFIPPADLNVWLEHTHRLVAGGVGLLIAALAIWTLARYRSRRDLLWPVVAAAVLVVVQAALGAFVVWLQLRAELVTAHLGMAMIVLACLLTVTVRATAPGGSAPSRRVSRLALISAAVAGLAFAQILVGGHVTGIGAGLAYGLSGFPLIEGAVIPAVASEREAFHLTHRLLAYLLAAAVVWLSVEAVRHRRRARAQATWTLEQRWLVRLPLSAAILMVVQILIGVANIATELSWVTVIPHLAVASWIWTALFLQALLAFRWAGASDLGAVTMPHEVDRPVRKVPA